FVFQAEDGIRDFHVTGVQTCALPIFNDDPTLFALERGTLAFEKAGPNTNSTQVFINYRENNYLASPEQNFTVFGKVVDGMDVVDAFVPLELDQARLWSEIGRASCREGVWSWGGAKSPINIAAL